MFEAVAAGYTNGAATAAAACEGMRGSKGPRMQRRMRSQRSRWCAAAGASSIQPMEPQGAVPSMWLPLDDTVSAVLGLRLLTPLASNAPPDHEARDSRAYFPPLPRSLCLRLWTRRWARCWRQRARHAMPPSRRSVSGTWSGRTFSHHAGARQTGRAG